MLRDDVLSPPGKPLGLHAVIEVGAATVSRSADPRIGKGDVVPLVQNSWGTGWGDHGYGPIGPGAWESMACAIINISPTP